MTAPTHIAFAELMYLLLLTTTGIALNPVNAALIAFSSILPDIDTGASRIGKLAPRISLPLERRFGHRTLTHSFPMVASLCLILTPLCMLNSDLYACILVGYVSHPLLDTGTVNGVKLFYPFSGVRCVFPMDVNNPGRYRAQTGSRTDMTLGIIFFTCCIPTFYIARQGYERFIRITQQSIESAVRDYSEFSRDHIVLASIEAHDMLTKQPLKGSFEVVGALNPHTLVFKGQDGRLHTLGKNFQADYVAQNVYCVPGEPSQATVRTVDLSNQLFAQLSALVDTSMENYFFGDIAAMDKVSLPENLRMFSPITGSGGTIKLIYARLSDIRDLNLDYVYVSRGILTIKSIWVQSAPPESTTAGAMVPRLQTFAQLTYLIDPEETVSFRKQKGDTIRTGDLIAIKVSPSFYDNQIAINKEKLAAEESRNDAALADIEQRWANEAMAASADSAEYAHALPLVARGFLAPSSLRPVEVKRKKEMRNLQHLVAERVLLKKKSTVEIGRLQLADLQLRARAEASRRRSEIHSLVNGILIEIRQVPHDNKTRLIFIVKRL